MSNQVVEGEHAVVYLLHFDRPFRHAKHYCGITKPQNLEARLEQHSRGRSGSHFMWHVHDHGIKFVLARTWTGKEGTRKRERWMKKAGLSKHCPICKGKEPMTYA